MKAGGPAEVLFLAYYYPPQKTSGAERPRRFVRYLPEFGYQATVIASAERHTARIVRAGAPDAAPAADTAGTRLRAWTADAAQRVLREHSARLPWAPRAEAAASSRIEAVRPAAILSTSPPLATHLAARQLKTRFGIPWIADFRDPFADNPMRSLPLQRVYDPCLERSLFEKADAVIANTDAVADLWLRRYPGHKRKIHLIWNGFDPAEELRPAPALARERRVLTHVGDIYGPRDPSFLLASLERLLGSGRVSAERMSVELVGPAEGSPMWNAPAFLALSARGVVSCNNRVIPREEALRAIASADYLLLLDVNPTTGNLQVPAKIFDYIRAGRPILATTRSGSAVDRILAQSGIPYVRIGPDDDDGAIDGKLGAFLAQPARAYEPSEWFWREFDGRNQTRMLASILDEIRARS